MKHKNSLGGGLMEAEKDFISGYADTWNPNS